MAGAPRVVVLDAIDAQMRAYLIESLKRPIAVNRATTGWGAVWGIVVLLLGLIVMGLHESNVEQGSPAGDFYSPYTFAIAAVVASFAGGLVIGTMQRSRSFKRLPQQGTFIVGTNVVLATERVHTVYSFADVENLEVVSHASGGGGLTLSVRISGITWNFVYYDKRTAFEVENQIRIHITRMDQAFQRADAATVIALDPYAYIVPHAVKLKRPASRWLLAVPVAALSVPIVYAVDRTADDTVFERCKQYSQSHRCSRYQHRNGRHEAAMKRLVCDTELANAKSDSDRERITAICNADTGGK